MSYSHRGTPAPRIQRGQSQAQILPEEPSIPETILIECARNTAPSLNNGLNSNPASWTCNFDGGIQLKKGDAISINSATLNSVGVGSLINFTLEGESQNNNATWIHSFYVVNDGKNDKRSSINMDVNNNGGMGMFRYDTTNNDCDLYRWTNTGADTDDATRSVSYYQDKFMPLRIEKIDPIITPIDMPINLSNLNMLIRIYTDNSTLSFGAQAQNFTYFSVHTADADGNLTSQVDLRTSLVFQRGRNYGMFPVTMPNFNLPNQFFDNNMNCIFGVVDIVYNVGNSVLNAPDGAYIQTTPMSPLIMDGDITRQQVQTRSVNFCEIIGEVNFSNLDTPSYAYTSVFYNWEDQLFNLGDDVYNINRQIMFDDTTSVQGIVSGELGVAKGKVVSSNVTKINIDILQLPSNPLDGDERAFPIQGYSNGTFKFKLNNATFNSIDDMVAGNFDVKQFGVRIFTSEGYKYGIFYLGTDKDTSTIKNRNIITCNSNVGIPLYFGIDQIPPTFTFNTSEYVLVNNSLIPTPVNSSDNPHQILFLGHLKNGGVNVRFYNTKKQYFTGNYDHSQNLITPASVTSEAYWAKQPFNEETPLEYNDLTGTLFNPCHIDGYTGGLMRNFNYFEIDGATKTTQFADDFQYVKHYESFSFEIDSKWNSPSDIATALTDQTHAPDNVRDTQGNIIPNSVNLGIPHNRLCIPVFTTNNATEQNLLDEVNLTEGSFKIIDPEYNNVSVTPAFVGDMHPQTITDTEVDIFFRTGKTSINFPSSIVNTPRNFLYVPANPINKTTLLPPDFNMGAALMGNTNYIRTARSVNSEGNVVDYPINYIGGQDAYISQFAGANDISFGWDDNLSRFTIGDLHVGIFSLSQIGDTATGGQDEVKVYCPAIPYKKNQTRSGGIFISNWYSIKPSVDMGIQTITEQINQPFNYDYNVNPINGNEWFLTSINSDIIGKRFWNKLGFDDTQIIQNTGSLINVSTNNEIDTAIAIVPSEEPASIRPAFNDVGNFATDKDTGGTAVEAGFEFSSFGNLNLNNHTIGMGGIPNTQGSPIQYFPNVTPSNGLQRKNFTTLTASESTSIIDSEGQYNPDKEINTYYTVSTRDDMTSTLDALNLPVKTEFSYFYILSDLVESKFYSSKNAGMPINCIGTINKLNSDNDFYFSYASPQRIYVTKDRVVTSITTSVKNIDFSDPAIIGDFSSVVYQIDRFNPQPEQIPLSIPIQQDLFFENLAMMAKDVLKSQNLPHNDNALEQVLDDLYIGGAPTDDREEIVNDIIEYGKEERLERQESAIQSITNDFLMERKGDKGKITKREFREYLDQRRDVPEDIIDDALASWRDVEEARQGMEASRRGGFTTNPELIARTRRGDVPRRGRRPEGYREPPPYILPPSFDEPNPTVEEDEE